MVMLFCFLSFFIWFGFLSFRFVFRYNSFRLNPFPLISCVSAHFESVLFVSLRILFHGVSFVFLFGCFVSLKRFLLL